VGRLLRTSSYEPPVAIRQAAPKPRRKRLLRA